MAATTASIIPNISQNERFYRYFREEATALQSEMSFLGEVSTTGGERLDAIDHCRSGIARLQKEVEDASSYVPAHDQKIYGEAIQGLNEKLTLTRAEVLPKSKFSFKGKRFEPSVSIGGISELAEQKGVAEQAHLASNPSNSNVSFRASSPPSELENASGSAPTAITSASGPEVLRRGSLGAFLRAAGVPSTSNPTTVLDGTSKDAAKITNEHSAHIILPSTAAHATASCTISSVRNSVVDISERTVTSKSTVSAVLAEARTRTSDQGFAALVVRNIRASLLICGSVIGAAHITSMESSVLVVAAGQMRLHDCRDCVVYLHVRSRPVIEDCSGMRFAPLPKAYTHLFPGSQAENQWNQVQDFKWLKADPSPNWQILPAEERLNEEVWTNIVPGGPGHALADILAAVGVTGHQ